jgi:putative Mn2+ efflux pump MntP
VSPGIPTKVIGACAGLTAFAIALVAGLAADNPAEDVLFRALIALVACQLIGGLVGMVGERTVREAIREYQSSHPVNSSSTVVSASTVETPGVAASSV